MALLWILYTLAPFQLSLMPVQCCAEGSITGLDDFYGPCWGQGIGLGHQEKYARKHNRVLCLIHFLGRIWHLMKPLRQPNWLLLRLHTPGSALAVSGGAIWSKISLGRVPKKNPNVTTFWVLFWKPLRNPCFGYSMSKWGPEKYPKLSFLGHLRPC